MKLNLFVFCCFFFPAYLFAQTADDAFKLSQRKPFGTARGMAVGGAFGALGADPTCIGINPAGLALYRKSEFSISPNIYFNNTNSSYIGNEIKDDKSAFLFNNATFTFAKNISKERDWVGVNFAIGYNRTAAFANQTTFEGFNTGNSITNYFAQQANGTSFDQLVNNLPYDSGLAWETYTINPGTEPNTYVGAAPNGGVLQQVTSTTRGGVGEIQLAAGANYKDKLYIGIGALIPNIKYENDLTFSEKDINDSIANFNSLSYLGSVNTEGNGFGANFGLIYRINDAFRVGASVRTPLFCTLKDTYSYDLKSLINTSAYSKQSPVGEFKYNLNTPWSATLSAAAIIKKYGFVSVDYEFTDYSQMGYSFDSEYINSELSINKNIDNKFTGTHNLRVGTEFAKNIFRVRAGYGFSTSPFKNNEGNLGVEQTFSGGLGIKEEKFSIDLAYLRGVNKLLYKPYSLNNQSVPVAALNNTSSNVVLTLGVNF